jgi:hypothetical protein
MSCRLTRFRQDCVEECRFVRAGSPDDQRPLGKYSARSERARARAAGSL